jgi:hypothetical protein
MGFTGEKSASRQFWKGHLIRFSSVLDDALEEKQEEKPFSQPVRGKGLTGCKNKRNKCGTSSRIFSLRNGGQWRFFGGVKIE